MEERVCSGVAEARVLRRAHDGSLHDKADNDSFPWVFWRWKGLFLGAAAPFARLPFSANFVGPKAKRVRGGGGVCQELRASRGRVSS